MINNPFFSIVTVCWNAEKEIEKTLESVACQDCKSYEYIIIDGASSDETLSIIKRYEDLIDTLVSEKDKGIYNAMNKGLRLAHGKYVIFMNAGDAFADYNVLSKIKKYIDEQYVIPSIVYGNYVRICQDSATQIIPARSAKNGWYGMFASHQSMFYQLEFLRREDLEYDETYKIAADYKLTLEIVKLSSKDQILQVPICVSRFDLGGISTLHQNDGLFEADRVRKEVLGMSSITRWCIRTLQLVTRILRENKNFKMVYSILRY